MFGCDPGAGDVVRAQGWTEKLHVPALTERVQFCRIEISVSHDVAEPKKESRGIEAGQDLDELAGGRIGDVDEGVRTASGRDDRVTGVGEKSPAVNLEQVSPFQNVECFRFPVSV